MPPATCASTRSHSCTFFDAATSAWRVSVPITTLVPMTLMPRSSGRSPRSIMALGLASRNLSGGIRLWPPANSFASAFLRASEAASLRLDGRWYSNEYMSVSRLKRFRVCFRRLHRLPHALRRRRHFDIPDAERRERVDDRVDHRRRRADRAGFAAALDPERVVRARRDFGADLERRQVVGARQRVVHQGAGQQLAALAIIDAAFKQRLTDA